MTSLDYQGTPKKTVTTLEGLPSRLQKRMDLMFPPVGDECIPNPFSYESYEVMEGENEIYDVRALFTLFYFGEPLSEFAFFKVCSKDKWCINPWHVTMKEYLVPPQSFFGMEKNADVIRAFVSRHDVYRPFVKRTCWENPLGDDEITQVRQLFGVTFNAWDDVKCALVEHPDYTDFISATCSATCVNPFHNGRGVVVEEPYPSIYDAATRSLGAVVSRIKSDAEVSLEKDAKAGAEAAKKKSERVAAALAVVRQAEFKRFIEEEIVSARDVFVCPSRKIAYPDESTVLKAQAKWYELELHTLMNQNSYPYSCSCGHWHLTKQNQELWSAWKTELVEAR